MSSLANANSAFAARACEKANPDGVPNPKFALPGQHPRCELRIRKGHHKPMIPVPLIDLKLLDELSAIAAGT
jgi:hypothetical protein